MTDDPFCTPNCTPPRQPSERLFEFRRRHDRFRCGLRDDGAHGVEARFFQNEELLYSRRFDTRARGVVG
jgi:hypothetical protein